MANHWLIGLALGMVIVTGSPGQEKGKSETGAPQVKREDLSLLSYDLVRDNKVEGDELKKLQVYLENTLVLYRQVTDRGQARVQSGRLVNQGGKVYEVVVIHAMTPGIVERTSWTTTKDLSTPLEVSVSFEPDCAMVFLGGGRLENDPSTSYCGQKYNALANLVVDPDVLAVMRTVIRDLQIDKRFVSEQSGILVDFKGTGPAGTVRVVPGRTIGK
jgi:hypothetical protein